MFMMCISGSLYSQQNMSGWYWLNGKPQTNDLKWVKIIDAEHIYAIGTSGTFMKSSDGGDSWIINSQAGVPDSYFGAGNTLDLNTAYFFNANTGLVGGQNDFNSTGAFVNRTTNGGASFTPVNLGISDPYPTVRDFYFINSSTGFLCGNNSVKAMKTTDAGLTWTPLPNVPEESYSCIYAKDAANIYLGYANDKIILKSTNGGSTWTTDTLQSSSYFTVQDIEFANGTTGYVIGNACYFGYTTDGGNSWTESAFPNTNSSLSKLTLNDGKAYALGTFDSYYFTSDKGVTWDSVSFEDPSNPYQSDPFFMYGMDINGNDIAVVGYGGKINTSNDAGSSWRNKNYDVGDNLFFFYDVFAESGNGKIWATGNGYGHTILYSSNGGTNWVQYNAGTFTNMYDLQMVNSSTGYCAGGNAWWGESDAIKTTDGGISWTSVYNNGQQFNSVEFVNAGTGWIFGGLPFFSGCTIVKTTDGGATWTDQYTTPLYTSAIADGEMFDENNGYCVAQYSVFKTTNGGINWNQLSMPNESAYYDKVKLLSRSNVIVGGGDRIYKSIDGGITWDSVFLPNPSITLFAMDWADQKNGIVTGTSGFTAKTTDGGITWSERNTGGSTIVSVQMLSKDTVFICSDRNAPSQIFRLYDNLTSISINITAGIEGFRDGSNQVSDYAKCCLRSSVSPYNIVDTATAKLGTDGFASFVFYNAPSGSYYIDMKHRNSIETWSASPVNMTAGGNYEYDFTTSAGKAFGSNMVLSSGVYCFFSGDVNQDGIVDASDLSLVENDAAASVSGYVPSDLTGDDYVDSSDLSLVENNADNAVMVITP